MRTQAELNDLVRRLVERADIAVVNTLADAVEAGEVKVTYSKGSVTFRTITEKSVVELGAKLTQLHEASGLTLQHISEQAYISWSSVQRALSGKVLPAWPTVRTLVQIMGGDPDEIRTLWEQAREERRRLKSGEEW